MISSFDRARQFHIDIDKGDKSLPLVNHVLLRIVKCECPPDINLTGIVACLYQTHRHDVDTYRKRWC